jgi:prevent-host-death family protein
LNKKKKRALLDALTKASSQDHPVTIERKDKPVAVVLPVEDYEEFKSRRDEKLKSMKHELDGILALVRSYTGRQSLEEVEARLAALRQEIEQEQEAKSKQKQKGK